METYHVEPLMVSVAARVRYLVVWNALKGNPISIDQAKKLRAGVQNMTGVPYEGPLVIRPARPVEQLLTLPLKRFKCRSI